MTDFEQRWVLEGRQKVLQRALLREIREELPWENESEIPPGLSYLIDHLALRLSEKYLWTTANLEEETIRIIRDEKRNPYNAIRRIRAAIVKIKRWAAECKQENKQIMREYTPPHLLELIGKKNVALFRKLARVTGHSDVRLWLAESA